MDETELIDALIDREGGFVANPADRGPHGQGDECSKAGNGR